MLLHSASESPHTGLLVCNFCCVDACTLAHWNACTGGNARHADVTPGLRLQCRVVPIHEWVRCASEDIPGCFPASAMVTVLRDGAPSSTAISQLALGDRVMVRFCKALRKSPALTVPPKQHRVEDRMQADMGDAFATPTLILPFAMTLTLARPSITLSLWWLAFGAFTCCCCCCSVSRSATRIFTRSLSVCFFFSQMHAVCLVSVLFCASGAAVTAGRPYRWQAGVLAHQQHPAL